MSLSLFSSKCIISVYLNSTISDDDYDDDDDDIIINQNLSPLLTHFGQCINRIIMQMKQGARCCTIIRSMWINLIYVPRSLVVQYT